jgi:uncharacterized repeat protein (TIGR03803 family)
MNARTIRTAAILRTVAVASIVSPLVLAATATAAHAQYGYAYSTVASFDGPNGETSYSGLTSDRATGMYGTAADGGTYGKGTVFHAISETHVVTLDSFNGDNGADPQGSLVLDSFGDLWGTTTYGGNFNKGVVYEIAWGSTYAQPIVSFNGTNGAYPLAGLSLDANGNIYGTTSSGGAYNDGTIFKIPNGNYTMTTVASFNGTNGSFPFSALTPDNAGNLYGTTFEGGSASDGTVYEVAAGTSTITTVATLHGSNGSLPQGNLVFDGSETLYGTTLEGGSAGDGTVFKYSLTGKLLSTIATFHGSNGIHPSGGLCFDSFGNLIGTAAAGVWGYGLVYQLPVNNGTLSSICAFEGVDGEAAVPYAGMARDEKGNLWGTSEQGGADGLGAIFFLQLYAESNVPK